MKYFLRNRHANIVTTAMYTTNECIYYNAKVNNNLIFRYCGLESILGRHLDQSTINWLN